MEAIQKVAFKNKKQLYGYINLKLTGLLSAETDPLANLSNASALLGLLVPDINWAGFYLMKEGRLKLGPFFGKPACTTLTLDRGVCGRAASTGKIQRIEDVHLFEGHVACDEASRAEIVLPLIQNQKMVGVLDIDSPILGRFDEEDETGLSKIRETVLCYIDFEKF